MAGFNVNDFLSGIKESEEKETKLQQDDLLAEASIKQSLKKISPFDYINSINNKTDVSQTDDYAPFMVNKLFSMHVDTILNAKLMNDIGQYLPNKMQYDYYMSTIRKGRRQWWYKNKNAQQNLDIEIVKELYKVNDDRAYELYDMLLATKPQELQQMLEQHRNREGGR